MWMCPFMPSSYFFLLVAIACSSLFGCGSTQSVSFTDATDILQALYGWFVPNGEAKFPSEWSWELNGLAHCQEIMKNGKGKTFKQNSQHLKMSQPVTASLRANSYMTNLVKIGEEQIPKWIKAKWFKESDSMLVFFREVFAVAKEMAKSLIKQNDGECANHLSVAGKDLALYKYQQMELFFVKCALHIGTEIDKKEALSRNSYYLPNWNYLTHGWRLNVPWILIKVKWTLNEETIGRLFTREMFTLNDGMAIVEFVQGIAANLCSLVNEGSRGGSSSYAKSWSSTSSSTFTNIYDLDFSGHLKCLREATKIKFDKIYTRILAKLEGMRDGAKIGHELLSYEFQRIRQRLADIEEYLDIPEHQKIQTFVAVLAKYGATILEDLLADLNEYNFMVYKKYNKIILNKYEYEGMLEWMEQCFRGMKRHAKYLVAAVTMAPNGLYAVEEYRAPKMRPTNRDGEKDIGKLRIIKEITEEMKLVIQLIEHGEDYAANIVDRNQLIWKLIKIGRDMKSPFANVFQNEKDAKLAGIYSVGIETAKKLDEKIWGEGAAEELFGILEKICEIPAIEERIGMALNSGEWAEEHGKGMAKEAVRIWKNLETKSVAYNKDGGVELLLKGPKMTEDEIYGEIGKNLKKISNSSTVAKTLHEKIEKLKILQNAIENILKSRQMEKIIITNEDEKIVMDQKGLKLHDGTLKEFRQIAIEEILKMREDAAANENGEGYKYNIIEIGTFNENAVIKLENLKLATYDEDGNPSSRDKHPLLRAPGELRYVSGKLTMSEQLAENTVLTVKLSAEICFTLGCGTICDRGKIGKDGQGADVNGEGDGKSSSSKSAWFSVPKINPMAAAKQAKDAMIKKIIKMMTGGQNICIYKTKVAKFLKDFNLGTVHFVENLFKNVFAELLEDAHYYGEEFGRDNEDKLRDRIMMAGMLEPERGFFELMAILPKQTSGMERIPANARWKIGLEVIDEMQTKTILSLKIPAKDYVDVKM